MNSDNKIDAIFIDLDGVLRHWPESNSALETEYGIPTGSIASVAFSHPLLDPTIHGRIQDHEWRKQIALELGRQFADADTESAVALWSKSCGDVDRQVLELLIRSRSKATIILATNATSRLSCDLQALGIDEHFDFIANSSDMGQIKPEAEYYRRALDIAGVRAERAVFIDDTIENVEQASIQGLHGHHYTGIEELKTFLSAHGLS